MEYEKLVKDQNLIREYIIRMGSDKSNDDIAPITDGLVDCESYLGASCRIAWVLKEPYDDFDDDGKPCGGGWDMSNIYNTTEDVYDNIKGNPTLNTMSYVTYGILEDKNYEFMPWIYEDPAVANSLRSVVHMNISKFPGKTTTAWKKLYSNYEYWRPILLFQLQVYKPHVIIFGNVMELFSEDLGLQDIIHSDYDKAVDYAIKNNCIYINAYHPSQRNAMKKEDYINGIVEIVREHSSEIDFSI